MLEARFVETSADWWVMYIDHDEKEFYYDDLETIASEFDLELTNEYIENAEEMWVQDPEEYISYLEFKGYTKKEI